MKTGLKIKLTTQINDRLINGGGGVYTAASHQGATRCFGFSFGERSCFYLVSRRETVSEIEVKCGCWLPVGLSVTLAAGLNLRTSLETIQPE